MYAKLHKFSTKLMLRTPLITSKSFGCPKYSSIFAHYLQMCAMIKENFIKLYEQSFVEHWDMPALTDYGEIGTLTYGQIAEKIARIHLLYSYCKIRRGDKIALIGKNNANWCVAYLASVTYGSIIVPILQDFNPNDIHHIINHSESVFLFISDNIWESLEEDKMLGTRAVFSLNDFRVLHQRDGETIQKYVKTLDEEFAVKYPQGFRKEDVKYTDLSNDKVMLINYTSGTTGFSKGVMLTGNNLAGNVTFGLKSQLLTDKSRILSFLPLAHAYGCTFDFLTSLAAGSHTTLLGKIPSPKILLKAFEEIKPTLIFTVPLVIEKIYRKQILPIITKRTMKYALSIPLLDVQIYAQVRKKLVDSMGGHFSQLIIGGAALNPEVEDFFYKIKFPFSVGYGMTECAPLISYTYWEEFVPGSCGRILPGMQVRVDSDDPENKPGEIQVIGENVMVGYYKNEEATKDAFTPDGWLRTGDLGTLTPDGTISIRGRSKSMILTSSGQNIYPEEIESKLNNLPFVMESLVIEKDGKLIALVYPDYEAVDNMEADHNSLNIIMEENRKELNKSLAAYENISEIKLFPTEFEKTPKKSIKRYLYMNMSVI